MMGGMVGNNSCGAHSPIYGTTRDHVLKIKTILSDGNEVEFKEIDKDTFEKKRNQTDLEGHLYKRFDEILGDKNNQDEIRREF